MSTNNGASGASNAVTAGSGCGQLSSVATWRNDYAKVASAQQQVNGVSGGLSMFPVAFNFAEFTNSLAQRGSKLDVESTTL